MGFVRSSTKFAVNPKIENHKQGFTKNMVPIFKSNDEFESNEFCSASIPFACTCGSSRSWNSRLGQSFRKSKPLRVSYEGNRAEIRTTNKRS